MESYKNMIPDFEKYFIILEQQKVSIKLGLVVKVLKNGCVMRDIMKFFNFDLMSSVLSALNEYSEQ